MLKPFSINIEDFDFGAGRQDANHSDSVDGPLRKLTVSFVVLVPTGSEFPSHHLRRRPKTLRMPDRRFPVSNFGVSVFGLTHRADHCASGDHKQHPPPRSRAGPEIERRGRFHEGAGASAPALSSERTVRPQWQPPPRLPTCGAIPVATIPVVQLPACRHPPFQ